MSKGVKARAWLVDYLVKLIRIRRDGDSADLLSELCRARLDDGRLLTDQEIADHLNMLMMAAHDTLASSLTTFVSLLAAHRDWQTQLREEVLELGLRPSDPTPFDGLDKLKRTEMAFKESLRLMPPVASIPRHTIREVEFKGFRIPADCPIGVAPIYTHYMADVWPDPYRFDPMRFTVEQSAPGTVTPSFPSAAALTCASASTTPSCRPARSLVISCRGSNSSCLPATSLRGACCQSPSQRTGCL